MRQRHTHRRVFQTGCGPFVKLAHYAAKRGNLHSLFIVREIADPEARDLVAWRYITFDRLGAICFVGTAAGWARHDRWQFGCREDSEMRV